MNGIVDGCVTPGREYPADALLRDMDRAGIACSVIGPEAHELAVRNVEGNERLLRLAGEYPDRFIPACAVTPWQRESALGILEDAVDSGARMLVFSPAVQGFMMTDALVDPLLECAGARGIPVYVHTGPHSHGAPSQTVLAAFKHARVRFILGHCGSTDHAWDMPAIAAHHMGGNVWLETSLARPWAVPGYLQVAGKDRVVFGSAAPLNRPALELEQLAGRLPPEEYPGLYGENLLRVLGERTPC